MHILVTNDDGPPSAGSSPYVHSFVRALQKAGHTVSVCLPHSQRSWIGKAHMIGQTVKPTYYQPSETFDPSPAAASGPSQGSTHTRPSKTKDVEEWILLDGTPASCAQIGLHHFFSEKGPVDLVVSGPNYGRNTTAVFALSSGTLGGALEAAVCRKKSIALSYAFDTRNHDPTIIDGASAHSVKVIEKLYAQWPTDKSLDLYTVNVPLIEGIAGKKVLFTHILQNYWAESGTCFDEVEGSVGDAEEEESRIREGEENPDAKKVPESKDSGYAHRHFKWAPKLGDVFKSVDESGEGNDGWAVKNGFTSVTPLKANFWNAASHLQGKELKMNTTETSVPTTVVPQDVILPVRTRSHFHALIAYDDPYVQPLILSALEKLFPPGTYSLLSAPSPASDQSEISLTGLLPSPDTRILQITPYEAIDWDYVAGHENTCLVNSYMLRKALIRKHYLAATVENWVAKRPESILRDHVKRSDAFELDYAEFLDDALVEAFDLRASLEKNDEEGATEASEKEWWILKPGMSDRGQGIRLFSTMEELQGIFDGWEEDESDSEEEVEEDNDQAVESEAKTDAEEPGRDYITTSHLRHFVAQPYIHPPLLVAGDDRKFHIRTYVLCVGGLDVYVYREMLALFAGKPYVAPWEASSSEEGGGIDLEAHLTNTCLQRSVADGTVRKFWDLELPAPTTRESVFEQVCGVTGEVFEAAARGMQMHFRPLPNAFELYGVDFLVDAAGAAWLLEVNAFPDFKQTGDELQGLVAGLWEDALRIAVRGWSVPGGAGSAEEDHEEEEEEEGDDDVSGGGSAQGRMVHVRHVELGRGW